MGMGAESDDEVQIIPFVKPKPPVIDILDDEDENQPPLENKDKTKKDQNSLVNKVGCYDCDRNVADGPELTTKTSSTSVDDIIEHVVTSYCSSDGNAPLDEECVGPNNRYPQNVVFGLNESQNFDENSEIRIARGIFESDFTDSETVTNLNVTNVSMTNSAKSPSSGPSRKRLQSNNRRKGDGTTKPRKKRMSEASQRTNEEIFNFLSTLGIFEPDEVPILSSPKRRRKEKTTLPRPTASELIDGCTTSVFDIPHNSIVSEECENPGNGDPPKTLPIQLSDKPSTCTNHESPSSVVCSRSTENRTEIETSFTGNSTEADNSPSDDPEIDKDKSFTSDSGIHKSQEFVVEIQSAKENNSESVQAMDNRDNSLNKDLDFEISEKELSQTEINIRTNLIVGSTQEIHSPKGQLESSLEEVQVLNSSSECETQVTEETPSSSLEINGDSVCICARCGTVSSTLTCLQCGMTNSEKSKIPKRWNNSQNPYPVLENLRFNSQSTKNPVLVPNPCAREFNETQLTNPSQRDQDGFCIPMASHENHKAARSCNKTGEKRKRVNNIPSYFPSHWTPEMIAYYDEDEKASQFSVDDIWDTLSDNPRLWRQREREFLPKPKAGKKIRCLNCNQWGHVSSQCPEKRKGPMCHLCGSNTHRLRRDAVGCPNSVCLNCGNHTPRMSPMTSCGKCRYWHRGKACNICKDIGHVSNKCPDLWRRYFSTTEMSEEGMSNGESPKYRKHYETYCARCSKIGHNYYHCREVVRRSKYVPANPKIQKPLPLLTSVQSKETPTSVSSRSSSKKNKTSSPKGESKTYTLTPSVEISLVSEGKPAPCSEYPDCQNKPYGGSKCDNLSLLPSEHKRMIEAQEDKKSFLTELKKRFGAEITVLHNQSSIHINSEKPDTVKKELLKNIHQFSSPQQQTEIIHSSSVTQATKEIEVITIDDDDDNNDTPKAKNCLSVIVLQSEMNLLLNESLSQNGIIKMVANTFKVEILLSKEQCSVDISGSTKSNRELSKKNLIYWLECQSANAPFSMIYDLAKDQLPGNQRNRIRSPSKGKIRNTPRTRSKNRGSKKLKRLVKKANNSFNTNNRIIPNIQPTRGQLVPEITHNFPPPCPTLPNPRPYVEHRRNPYISDYQIGGGNQLYTDFSSFNYNETPQNFFPPYGFNNNFNYNNNNNYNYNNNFGNRLRYYNMPFE